MIVNNVCELIGNTPIVKLRNLVDDKMADVYLKLEWFNPGGSVKDRVALNMIIEAEKEGLIKPGDIIIEPTSGNTGIGLGLVAAAKGYKLIATMPESMSIERRKLLTGYGAKLILTDPKKGMNGAINKAKELAVANGYYMPQQFININNPKAHMKHTAREIIKDIPDLSALVVGVGTGGTISGCGEILKKTIPDIAIKAVEPKDSPVLSGGNPGPHKIQGIGAGFVPGTLNTNIYDEIIKVSNEQAFDTARKLAKEEGLLVGISTGANVYAAIEVAKKLGAGKKVLTFSPSNGERYLSTDLYK